MTSSLERSDPYKVEYLGSAMLPRMATGLGALQKPLRELYFRHRKPGSGSRLQERHIAIGRDCMKVKYRTGGSNGGMTEEAFPAPNLLYWDAIRFVTVKAPDKKLRGAFEPLDNDHSRCQDNLFVILDKKVGFLAQMSHPALFVCVLRRIYGVRSLDLHAFVCANERDALAIVRALRALTADYEHAQAHNHGVFSYTPFDQDVDVTGNGMLDVVPPPHRPAPFVGSVSVRQMAPPPSGDAGARFFKLTQGDFGALSAHQQQRYSGDETYERVIASSGPGCTRAPSGGQPALSSHVNPGFVCGHQYGHAKYADKRDSSPGRSQSMSRSSRYEMGASLANRLQRRSKSPSYERTIPRNDDRRRTIIDADDHRRTAGDHSERSWMAPSHFGQGRDRPPSPPREPPQARSSGTDASRSQFGSSSSSRSRPVALVQPHKIQGIRVLPTGAMFSSKKTDLDRSKSPTEALKPAAIAAKPFQKDDHVIRNLRDCRSGVTKTATDNWQFKTSRPTDFDAPSDGELSQHRTEDEKSSGRLLLTAKKDAEIASVVQNLQLDQDTYMMTSSGVTNFEKSLGYFP